MRNEAHAPQVLRLLLPDIGRFIPAGEKFGGVRPIPAAVCRVELGKPLGQRLGNALNAARMQVHVRIALRMHVALRPVDALRNLEAPHEVRGQEMPGRAGLDVRVARAPQQQRQPADLEVRTAADEQVRATGGGDKARPGLQAVRVLERRCRNRDLSVGAGDLGDERAPFGFADENVQGAGGRGRHEREQCDCDLSHAVP